MAGPFVETVQTVGTLVIVVSVDPARPIAS
jgi:hypothetical protein